MDAVFKPEVGLAISYGEGVCPVASMAQDVVEPVSILAVIVLYRMTASRSPALRSLQTSAMALHPSDLRLKILLYDNTPGAQKSEELPANTEYWPAGSNQGLASAYNFALRMAAGQGFNWLLTLDQDTTVPPAFLGCIATLAREQASRSNIAGFVPEVVDHGVFISPHIQIGGRTRRLPEKFLGVPVGQVSAINSGAVWRTQSLSNIGGFNPLFWLDYLDHWLYHVMQHSGRRIYVVGGLRVEHELSLSNSGNRVSAERLANILGAESAFYDLYKSTASGLLLTVNLFARMSRQMLRPGGGDLWRVIWSCLQRRIVCRRPTRIMQWEQQMRQRLEKLS